MPKNIVICCDGTGNEYGKNHTNVLRLYTSLIHDRTRQIAFYDPGVGTFSIRPMVTKPGLALQKGIGLAFGVGLRENVTDAYTFLMNSVGAGDKVFIFGFSWDTVSSVAWLWDKLYYLYTARNKAANVVRHAVSIDERRAFFRTNLVGAPHPDQDLKQVWFPGVHCDVGGGYPNAESGLSKLALEWMLCEARDKGLMIKTDRASEILEKGDPPNPEAKLHRSLKGMWRPCELVPRLAYSHGKRRLRCNFGRRRPIPEEAVLHESVTIRKDTGGYDPKNLPQAFTTEPWVRF